MNNVINLLNVQKQIDKKKEYIEYNGKKIRMPFKGYFNDQRMVQTTNPWSGESVFLPRFAQDVYHKIKNAELHQDYKTMRKGLDWFQKHFIDEYFVLLD